TQQKETPMYRTLCKSTGLALMLALALVSVGIAQQQQQPQQHHPGGPLPPQGQPAATDAQEDDESDKPAPMMQQMHDMRQQVQNRMQQMQSRMGGGRMGGGMMGRGGMMQHHFEHVAQQLGLNDDQRAQVKAIMRNHAKEIIRLSADIAALQLDVRQLLDA